jgi:hypothetical protein
LHVAAGIRDAAMAFRPHFGLDGLAVRAISGAMVPVDTASPVFNELKREESLRAASEGLA